MLVICVKEFLNRNLGYSFDNKLASGFMIFVISVVVCTRFFFLIIVYVVVFG